MKAKSTHFHAISSGRETCTGVFKIGKYAVNREFDLYKDGDVWRLVKNNKEVEINE